MSADRIFVSEGHLIDSGILANILNLIVEEGADYSILDFRIGKSNLQTSRIELQVFCADTTRLDRVTDRLIRHGCYEKQVSDVDVRPAPKDGAVPDEFYSTANHRTEVYYGGAWHEVKGQRMDAVIVVTDDGPVCKKLRDIRRGDHVVCSAESVRVFPPARDRSSEPFGFMVGEVSSERTVDVAVAQIADELIQCRRNGRKVVAVAGPVVVHTGGSGAFVEILRGGYIGGVLSGNALAVHDVENAMMGTSLGLNLSTGRPTAEGHRNHMLAINRVRAAGSLEACVRSGTVASGIMHELIVREIPYCLAGSIRDDGPLPETVTDIVEAQECYADILEDAYMVIMLATMLHSIGVGNMLPSWVKTVCVDINPAVVTKLSDRGSSQTIGIVSDVGFFLRALAARLEQIGGACCDDGDQE